MKRTYHFASYTLTKQNLIFYHDIEVRQVFLIQQQIKIKIWYQHLLVNYHSLLSYNWCLDFVENIQWYLDEWQNTSTVSMNRMSSNEDFDELEAKMREISTTKKSLFLSFIVR